MLSFDDVIMYIVVISSMTITISIIVIAIISLTTRLQQVLIYNYLNWLYWNTCLCFKKQYGPPTAKMAVVDYHVMSFCLEKVADCQKDDLRSKR